MRVLEFRSPQENGR
ncbi:hypothetical protein U0070_013629 [Myodes glareolus]|uniref:Uncharacterized protein n=1 Tax=Myodes glareolus TaxID=447135 RepID=A0AAW0JLT7_MYOGA